MNAASPVPMRLDVPTSSPAAVAPSPRADDKIGREDRSALICCHEPSYQEFLAGQLRSLGYKVHHAPSAQAALQRLTLRSYHLIALLENIEGCRLADNALLQHIAALPTDDRHEIYVILLCQSFATGDELNAYAQSVDHLINYQDITHFAELVAPALEDHEVANRHFQTALREVGK